MLRFSMGNAILNKLMIFLSLLARDVVVPPRASGTEVRPLSLQKPPPHASSLQSATGALHRAIQWHA